MIHHITSISSNIKILIDTRKFIISQWTHKFEFLFSKLSVASLINSFSSCHVIYSLNLHALRILVYVSQLKYELLMNRHFSRWVSIKGYYWRPVHTSNNIGISIKTYYLRIDVDNKLRTQLGRIQFLLVISFSLDAIQMQPYGYTQQ